jgi:hypothetical protein
MQTFESGFVTTLSKRAEPADTTLYLASVPTVTKGRMYMSNWEIEERISFTGVSWSTITGVTRWLSQTADPATAGTGQVWIAGTKIKLVAMHDQMLDKLEGDDVLISATVYASTAARDSALWADWVATKAYTNVYVTATGLFYNYNLSTAQWETVETGTATPNASPTVSWSLEVPTAAQMTAGTQLWETWAYLATTPDLTATQIQSWTWTYWADAGGDDTYVVALTPTLSAYTTWQTLRAKVTTANTGACSFNFWPWVKNVKTLDGNDPQTWAIRANMVVELVYDGTNLILQSEDIASTSNKWITETLTDAEFYTGTDTTRYVNSLQANYYFTIIAWTNVFASADTERSVLWITYTKVKEITILKAGTYTIDFDLRNWWATTWFGRVYKNWVAFGTEQSQATDVYTTKSENLTFAAWDLCQLYLKHNWAWWTAYAQNFRVKWALAVNPEWLPDAYIWTVVTN